MCVCKAEDNQKKADRLYDLKMKELDQRACELQHAEEECRNAIGEATKNYNLAQVSFVFFFIFITAIYNAIVIMGFSFIYHLHSLCLCVEWDIKLLTHSLF